MRPRALLRLVLAVPLLSGCSGSVGGGPGTGAGFTVAGALATLPDPAPHHGGVVHVVVGDLGALGGGTGSARREPQGRWTARLERAGVLALLPADLGAQDSAGGGVRRVLGFDARDVVSYAAIEDDADGLAVLSLADGAGLRKDVQTTGRGDPGDRAAAGSPFPVVLGVAQRAGSVALARSADVLVDWADRGPSLDGDDALAAVARALDGEHVVAAELVGGGGSGAAYDAVGVGQEVRAGRVTTWVAYRTEHPARLASVVRRTWREGRSRSGRRLSSLARVRRVSTGEDTVLLALAPRRPGTVVGLLRSADTPFAGVPPTEE